MRTFSFYTFQSIEAGYPHLRRLYLDRLGLGLGCVGRIYLCRHEGVNGYVSVPSSVSPTEFRQALELGHDLQLNEATEEGQVFSKLHVRWRSSLVNVGRQHEPGLNRMVRGSGARRLDAQQWNQELEDPNAVLIDARNRYEIEVGQMQTRASLVGHNAERFRDQVDLVLEQLRDGPKDRKILMFCTSGIRCEKLSVVLEEHGYQNMAQLNGGVTEYVREARRKGMEIKFRGKLFTFDEKLGQQITPDEHLGRCHICGTPTSSHWNCTYKPCHKLHLQCDSCHRRLMGSCSSECASQVVLLKH